MDNLRNSLKAAENHARQEIDRHNNVLKPDLEPTARSALIPEKSSPFASVSLKGTAGPTKAEVKFNTRYKGITLTSSIVNVLNRMGEPVNSKKIHEELAKGGWTSNSKDSLMAVRNALVRMKGDIKSEKVEGIFHYSLLPIKELV